MSKIKYQHRTDYSSSYPTIWKLETSTSPSNSSSDWTTVSTYDGSVSDHPTTFREVNQTASVTPETTVYVGWYATNNNQDGIRIDNIDISYTSSTLQGAGIYVQSGNGAIIENNIITIPLFIVISFLVFFQLYTELIIFQRKKQILSIF